MEEEMLVPETPAVVPEEADASTPSMVEVVDIQFRPGQKIYFFDPDGLTLQPGDPVIIDTARGPEFGLCANGNHEIKLSQVVSPLRKVLRRASELDQRIVAENRQKEKQAFDICLKKIADHGLDMQLVSTEYVFDGSKIIFYFTADERVDFRELVKNLASTFHVRIELRQIGVRDKAKMVGGLGICGRPLCCASFLSDFQPVSIKMAKTQNLSLNPTKISGTCGRLMCCLKYEQEAYEDLLRTSPKAESFVDTPDGRGTVVEVNLLAQKVRVRMENQPETISTYANSDIAVLRSGKARKNDSPIPDDWAPISGNRVKQERKPEQEEEPSLLEPVKFRYRMDNVVEETEPQPKEPEKPRRSRKPKPGEQEQKTRFSRHPRQGDQVKSPEQKSRLGDQIKTLEQKTRQGDQIKTLEQRPKQSRPPRAGDREPDGNQEQRPRKNFRKPYYRRGGHKPQHSGENKSE